MQVNQRLNALTSLHFFAAAMIVIGHADVIFHSSIAISKNTFWVQDFFVSREQFEKSDSIGFAMYKEPATLFTVHSNVESDWGQKRLIFSLSH